MDGRQESSERMVLAEEEPAKRRRSEPPSSSADPSSASGGKSHSRDVYHDVLLSSSSNAGESFVSCLPQDARTCAPVSSWLTSVEWISSSSWITSHAEEPINEQEDSTFATSSITTASNISNIQKEIQTLSSQLLQVKRRLGPAAERVAEAYNASACCVEGRAGAAVGTTGQREFQQARRFCNPFEILGEGRHRGLNNHLFMNRSAIKLANLDALLEFGLTAAHQRCHNNNSDDDDDDADDGNSRSTLSFADLCGAPGGFSEYILWRCQSFDMAACLGYGMSLIGTNEQGRGLVWKLQDEAHNDNRGMYSHYRICIGVDGSGDIYQWQNVEHLQRIIQSDTTVKRNTDSSHSGRVHLVVADGGFDSQRDAENQEELAQKLVVCEVAAALLLLSPGGALVLKIFGAQTDVIRVILQHLFFAFDSLVLIKPISSRPASAERYLVCTGFHGNPYGWSGSRWVNQMLLGQSCPLSNFPAKLPHYGRAQLAFARYLDKFDRDMLNLNLKACFSILSYLESKCQRLLSSRGNGRMDVDNDGNEMSDGSSTDEAPHVNIASYRYAWRLS